jgi:DNA repair protein RecO (recombination protein O)
MGEADRHVTLLTPHHGKIEAVAKGARKAESAKSGHLELFTQVDCLITKGRELDILTQVELIEPYLALREDLDRSAYANYVIELLDRFIFVGDTELGTVFTLLHETLLHLCEDADVRRLVRYYELQLLDEMGFRPELHECVVSHEPIMPIDQFFSFADGGAVAPEAAHQSAGLVTLPVTTLKVLRHLQRSTYAQVAKLRVPDAVHQDVERVLQGYIRYLLESRLQSLEFIRQVRRQKPPQ